MADQDKIAFEAATAYFGAKLREILDTGATRTDIAMKIGIQGSTVGRLISGARVNALLETVLRTAHAYDMEPSELMPSLSELKAMVAGARANEN